MNANEIIDGYGNNCRSYLNNETCESDFIDFFDVFKIEFYIAQFDF